MSKNNHKCKFQTYYAKAALKQAQNGYKNQEIPIGCVIFDPDTKDIIVETHNMVETLKDVTAHAEIIAIREATSILGVKYLDKYCMYTTLEPCPMCIAAISYSRIMRLYYGADNIVYDVNRRYNINHEPEIYSDIFIDRSKDLLQKFFSYKRDK